MYKVLFAMVFVGMVGYAYKKEVKSYNERFNALYGEIVIPDSNDYCFTESERE